MLTLALIGQGVFVLGVLMFSARVTIRSRSVLKGTLCLYGLYVACVVLFALVIPALLGGLGVPQEIIAHSFPDEIGIVPAMLVGWIPAVIYAGIIRFFYLAGKKGRRCPDTSSSAAQESNDTQECIQRCE